MTRSDWIALLESVASGAQVINLGVGVATKNAWLTLIIGAVVQAIQTFAAKLGTATVPEAAQNQLTALQDTVNTQRQTVQQTVATLQTLAPALVQRPTVQPTTVGATGQPPTSPAVGRF